MIPTLILIQKAPEGLYRPADHESQVLALSHFSGDGCVAITPSRLQEVIYVAGLHGWKVSTEQLWNPTPQ